MCDCKNKEFDNPPEIFNDSDTLALYIITVPNPQREKINNTSDLSNLFVMMFNGLLWMQKEQRVSF